MYNLVIAILTAVISCFTFCGCEKSTSVGVKFENTEYIADRMSVKAQVPHFTKIADKNFQDSLNSDYQTEIQSWIDEFMISVSPEVNSEFKIEQKVAYNKNNFVSMVSEIYTYSGGAHGAVTQVSSNIDINRSCTVKMSDIFGADSGYKDAVNTIMLKMTEENQTQYANLWEKPMLTQRQEDDFYIKDGNLVIYYQPYELSYYARGVVEFAIPLESLSQYMNNEYKRLM